MNKHAPVSTIMTDRVLVTIDVRARPSELRRLLDQNPIHHVPVLDGDAVVGLISTVDLLRYLHTDVPRSPTERDAELDRLVTVAQIMHRPVVSVRPTETIKEAARLLSNGRFHSLPVIEEGKLVGMLTTTDLIRYLFESLH